MTNKEIKIANEKMEMKIKRSVKMSKNYKKGEPITTTEELMKERVAFFNGRVINREFFQTFQFRFILNQVEYGRVHKAVPINPQSVSEPSKVGYYYTINDYSMTLCITREGFEPLCISLPYISEYNNYAFSISLMKELFATLGIEKLDKMP